MKLNGGLLRFDFDELYFDILRTERKRDVCRRTQGAFDLKPGMKDDLLMEVRASRQYNSEPGQ